MVACDTFYSIALAKATAGAIATSQATARLVLDPCRPTRPQFVDELKRLEVASWDGGADVAFRPLPIDAGAVRFDGDASDEQFAFDGCYAAGFGQLPADRHAGDAAAEVVDLSPAKLSEMVQEEQDSASTG